MLLASSAGSCSWLRFASIRLGSLRVASRRFQRTSPTRLASLTFLGVCGVRPSHVALALRRMQCLRWECFLRRPSAAALVVCVLPWPHTPTRPKTVQGAGAARGCTMHTASSTPSTLSPPPNSPGSDDATWRRRRRRCPWQWRCASRFFYLSPFSSRVVVWPSAVRRVKFEVGEARSTTMYPDRAKCYECNE